MITTGVTELTRLSVGVNGRVTPGGSRQRRQNRRTARQSVRICADIAGEMDTRDDDQETGAPADGRPLGQPSANPRPSPPPAGSPPTASQAPAGSPPAANQTPAGAAAGSPPAASQPPAGARPDPPPAASQAPAGSPPAANKAPADAAAGSPPAPGRPGPGPAAGRSGPALAFAGRPLTGWFALSLALLAAALLAAGVLRFGWSALLPAYCYLALVSIPLAVIDVLSRRLPDRLTLPSYPIALALLGGAALAVPGGGQHYLHALIGMAASAAFYGVLWLVSPASIGLGDVKLAGVLGLYLGWFGARAAVIGLLGGFVLAAVVGVILIAARRATRKSHIPFGPFMLAATLAVLLTPALSS